MRQVHGDVRNGDKQAAFEYRSSATAGNPAAYDILKSIQGRTISIIVTKTW